MKTPSFAAALGAALVLPALAACGTTDASGGNNDAGPVTSEDCADDSTATATDPVTLTDGWDRTVELGEPADRVAVLEWGQTEAVLSLCVSPVAVADAEGYSLWDTAEELPEGVVDVGTRGEPNVEALLAEDPDLVIVSAYSAEDEIITTLTEYDVPVLATRAADGEDQIGQMKDTFTLIAEALGRTERADVVLDQFDQTVAEAKAEIADTDSAITDFVYFDGWIQGGNVAFRPFGQGSLVGELGEEVGLTNAWTGEVDPAWGLGQTDVEGMSSLGDATFFYTGTVDPSGDIFTELENNQLWQQIPAVADGRIHAFPEGIWTFGGPKSAEQIVEAFAAAVTANPAQ